MTTEQKLQAVIEAQVKGGYDFWEKRLGGTKLGQDEYGPSIGRYTLSDDGRLQDYEWAYGVIEVLLDPEGLRAAYGESYIVTYWEESVPHRVLDTWLSSDGNAEKTIDCAYDLLPKE